MVKKSFVRLSVALFHFCHLYRKQIQPSDIMRNMSRQELTCIFSKTSNHYSCLEAQRLFYGVYGETSQGIKLNYDRSVLIFNHI